MRILWVKAGGVVPLDTGGKIRSYHLLRALARKHELTLFTFYAAHAGDAHAQLERDLARVVCWPLKLPPAKSLREAASYARSFASTEPYNITKYCRPEVARGLRHVVRTESPDVLVCDFVQAAGVVPWDWGGAKVLFTHNVEAQIWRRHYQVARNPLWKLVCRREFWAMERAERRYLALADHVLTVSEADRAFFSRHLDPAKITAIPTGVDVEYFRPEPGGEQENRLVFTGSMDWMPNEDAVVYFTQQILPLLRRSVPDATLWVVGRRPTPRLEALAAGTNGLKLTGTVEDIRPYVREGAVYVVPLRVGSGTRIKIFEAMAMGKAVVSTSLGAEGLPVRHGTNILLADDPQDFAHQVERLLRDPAARGSLGEAGRQLVERDYSWGAVAGELESLLAAKARRPLQHSSAI